ncbi:protease inhibitor I42 family protein [Stutzerimonas azotifigens]|uniref:protease inhibitor I42 family protein n=1 Tax=Stutzerimonas azotifigens TaxID=291995 RepID=UPI0004254FD9|nr:protease inhibitor I42 family protein [Stutzerimonas azotifigens]
MTSTPRLYLTAGLLAGLAGCSSTPPSSVALRDDSNCPLDLHLGQTLILSLPSNPASGFRWAVLEAAPEVLTPLGPEVFSNPDENALIGGDGLSTWRFEVTGTGSGELVLNYKRPWEAEPVPADAFECHVEAS